MNVAASIDLRDWDVSYTELVRWSKESRIDIYGVNTMGGNGAKIYVFEKAEDFTAFQLMFRKKPSAQYDLDF